MESSLPIPEYSEILQRYCELAKIPITLFFKSESKETSLRTINLINEIRNERSLAVNKGEDICKFKPKCPRQQTLFNLKRDEIVNYFHNVMGYDVLIENEILIISWKK